jgi:hypothetical protein
MGNCSTAQKIIGNIKLITGKTEMGVEVSFYEFSILVGNLFPYFITRCLSICNKNIWLIGHKARMEKTKITICP